MDRYKTKGVGTVTLSRNLVGKGGRRGEIDSLLSRRPTIKSIVCPMFSNYTPCQFGVYLSHSALWYILCPMSKSTRGG